MHNITIDYSVKGETRKYLPHFGNYHYVVILDFAILDNGILTGYCAHDMDGYEIRGTYERFSK